MSKTAFLLFTQHLDYCNMEKKILWILTVYVTLLKGKRPYATTVYRCFKVSETLLTIMCVWMFVVDPLSSECLHGLLQPLLFLHGLDV